MAPAGIKQRLRLFWLPPGAPACTPDARAWQAVKQNVTSQQLVPTLVQLHDAVLRHARVLQKPPARMRSSCNNATTR